MKIMILFIMALVMNVNAAIKYPPGWEHADPPPGDEFLTNRFGRSWSEPISNSFVIAEGKFIDGPHVVEQRGYAIFVNGARITDGYDIRYILPLPEPEPVTKDPGTPTNVMKDTSIWKFSLDKQYDDKKSYWSYLGLKDEERIKAEVEYLEKLPCVAKVEDTKSPGVGGAGRLLIVTDYSGHVMRKNIMTGPWVPKTCPSDEYLYQRIIGERESMVKILKRGMLIFITNGGIVHERGAPEPNDKWVETFKTFDNNESVSNKIAELRRLGFASGYHDELCTQIFPLTNFVASDQLWQRVYGSEWGAEETKRIRELTSRWERIEPAFKRKTTGTTNTRTVQIQEAQSNKAQTKTSEPVSAQKSSPVRIAAIILWAIAVVVALIVMRRK